MLVLQPNTAAMPRDMSVTMHTFWAAKFARFMRCYHTSTVWEFPKDTVTNFDAKKAHAAFLAAAAEGIEEEQLVVSAAAAAAAPKKKKKKSK